METRKNRLKIITTEYNGIKQLEKEIQIYRNQEYKTDCEEK